jgi:Chaperone of endosialidase
MRKTQIKSVLVMISTSAVLSTNAQTSGTSGRWDLRGNSGINTSLNFLGTTDAQNLIFKTTNTERMKISATGEITIGTTPFYGGSKMEISTNNQTTGFTSTSYYTSSASVGVQGIGDNSVTQDAIGVRGYGQGAGGVNVGVSGVASQGDSNIGLKGESTGTGSAQVNFGAYLVTNGIANSKYGVYSNATGSGVSNIAVYGNASGATTNWAGYFVGNTNVTDTARARVMYVGSSIGTAVNLLRVGSTTNDGISIGSAEFIRDGGANILSFGASLYPNSDASRSLGSSTFRYTTLYATSGTINTSDRRDKTNITQIKYGLNDIMKLNPVSFTWKERADEGTKLGLIAQELQQVLPEVVRDYDVETDEATGKTKHVEAVRLGVFYSDIIPVLIKGMQEQQQQIEGLEALVEKLISNNTNGLKNQSTGDATEKFNLKSAPNPAGNKTLFSFSLPVQFKNAQLLIIDSNGKKVKAFENFAAGENAVSFETANLKSGSFIYSLVVDGKTVDTKILSVIK